MQYTSTENLNNMYKNIIENRINKKKKLKFKIISPP